MLFGAQIIKKDTFAASDFFVLFDENSSLTFKWCCWGPYKTDIIAHSTRKISMVRHAKTHQSPPYTTLPPSSYFLHCKQHLSFLEVVKLLSICWLAYNRIRFHEKKSRQHHRKNPTKDKEFIIATKFGYSISLNFLSFSIL